jgi:diguanylate cyclase (GGDEF)-like protein
MPVNIFERNFSNSGASTVRSGPGRVQTWFALSVIAMLVIGAAIVTPHSGMPLKPIPGLLTAFSTAMIVTNLLLAAMLFIKGRVEEGPDTIRLGAAYLYVGLVVIPQTMSFPGALTDAPLIGSTETSLWFWVCWHVGFGLAVIRYAWCSGRQNLPRFGIFRPVAEIIAAASVVTYVAVVWANDLPRLLVNGHFELSGVGLVIHVVVVLVTLSALLSVARLRAATPEQLWLVVGLVASCAEVWLTLHSSARFALGWYLAKAGSLLTSFFVLVSLMHEITRLYSEAAINNRTLANLARLDGLTGVSNRRHFDETLAEEFRRARRTGMPLGLIMMDVDHFKAFNDRYGHPAGDECLRRVASVLEKTVCRPGDKAFRYGGEEFAVLLPATPLEGARVIAEKILRSVAALALEHLGSPHGIVTLSAGVASALPMRDDDLASQLIETADHALYDAKKAGRNRVKMAVPQREVLRVA